MYFFEKRILTNLIAIFLVFLGFFFPEESWSNAVLNSGLFAFSGAITNWIAVYMLFERVPGIYGSGVIPLNFEIFKKSIHELIMIQFFNTEILKKSFSDSENIKLIPNFEKIFHGLNFDPVFDSLLEVIEKSSIGTMLSMVGGIKALEPLREPFKDKFKVAIKKISETQQFKDSLREQFSNNAFNKDVFNKIDDIVLKRLEELTPEMVKEIVERIIHKHLGWLVVWGGIFGGIMGMMAGLLIK